MNIKNLDSDFISIKEFADFVGIPASALRHYDRYGVFSPAKHGIEFQNKYRYYSPLQITMVKMIRILVEIGVSLSTIKELSLYRTPEIVLKLISKYKNKVYYEIRFLQDVGSVISTFTDLLNEAMSVTETELTIKEMTGKQIILGDITDYTDEIGFVREFVRFCSAPHEPKLNMSFPIGGYWYGMADFLNEPSRPSRFFSLDPKGYEQKEAGLYIVGYTRGYYGQTNDLPQRLAAFTKKNGLLFSGPVYNLYLLDEISVNDPMQYLLQASASVKETRRVHSRRPRRRY